MDLFRFDPPELDRAAVVDMAARRWRLEVRSVRRLRGERSHNSLIETADGRLLVLKVQSASEDPATIEFHAQALVHLASVDPSLPIERMVPTLDGELVPILRRDGRAHPVRLVTYLPGVTFHDGQMVSVGACRAIGALLGRVSHGLATFDHPAADAFMPWDIANGLIADGELRAGASPATRRLVAAADDRLASARAAMAVLPRQVIHNDGHAGNLLRADESSEVVTGLIDFGDLVRTVTVADVAVAAANLAPHQADPCVAAAAIAAGYHVHRPLDDAEIAALADLVLARISLSSLLVEHQIAHAPHIADDVRLELPLLHRALQSWLAIDPADVTDAVHRSLQEDP